MHLGRPCFFHCAPLLFDCLVISPVYLVVGCCSMGATVSFGSCHRPSVHPCSIKVWYKEPTYNLPRVFVRDMIRSTRSLIRLAEMKGVIPSGCNMVNRPLKIILNGLSLFSVYSARWICPKSNSQRGLATRSSSASPDDQLHIKQGNQQIDKWKWTHTWFTVCWHILGSQHLFRSHTISSFDPTNFQMQVCPFVGSL